MSNDVANNKKGLNVPNLRFPEFTNKWEWKKLSDFAKKNIKKNSNNICHNVICNSAQYGLIKQIDFFDKEIADENNTESYFLINKDDFVYNPRKSISAPYGPVNIYNYEECGIVSPLYLCFSVKDINYDFLLERFKSPCWHRYVYLNGDSGARHDRVSIKDDVFLSQPIAAPSFTEQEKISAFLLKINKRIETQNKIIKSYESLINGLRESIFRAVKGDEINIGYFLKDYSLKNTDNNLTPVSVGKYGIRFRDSIYNKELTGDLSKNKVIFKDTLTIGMGSEQIDIGILCDDNKYCVSPAYSTYKIRNIDSYYLNEYLIYLNPLLSKRYMIIGARQGKSVNKKELLLHPITIHSKDEQTIIINLFKSINSKIENEKKVLNLLNKQKEFLLQNMFI